jgi:hypothetical protein
MSTSEQRGPLTRKQLREIRLTGSTPVITDEEAAAAVEQTPPAPQKPRSAEPVRVPPAPPADSSVDLDAAPLTRRQAREQEKIKTASVPVVGGEEEQTDTAAEDAAATTPAPTAVEPAEEPGVVEPAAAEPVAEAEIVSGVPDFGRASTPVTAVETDADEEIVVEPVSAAEVVETVGEVPLVAEQPAAVPAEGDVAVALGIPAPTADDDVHEDADDDDTPSGARPTVSPAFGEGVLADAPEAHAPFRPSFDELLTSGDSGGSQHSAPSALIFTPSPGEGSLSGPVASTGEILVTGSYELPKGLGSQGHAHGTTDGKDVDAVLIDGELAPASSPTPIAASSAISTLKPAGEVIRPPAPEKGNRLMLTLSIIAGGLFLAVAVVVVIAITTNVF